jgi:hypothetical protein
MASRRYKHVGGMQIDPKIGRHDVDLWLLSLMSIAIKELLSQKFKVDLKAGSPF